VYIELLKGTDFATIARQSSQSPTANKGGDMGFVSYEFDPQKRIRFDKFYEIAFAPTLEAGNISSIFKGPEGYYIIKIESIEKTEAKPLNELWDNIKSYLLFIKQQKAISDLANKLSGEIKIEMYEGKIE
jgi:parvulin-like peptidyl-prolyl isomerase